MTDVQALMLPSADITLSPSVDISSSIWATETASYLGFALWIAAVSSLNWSLANGQLMPCQQ